MSWALVTGGNRGLGFAVCQRLASQGKPVILTSRDAAAGARAAQQLRAGWPAVKVEVLECEVAIASSVKGLASTVAERFDSEVDLLVVNAGIYPTKWGQQELASAVAVNFEGAVQTALGLAPHLKPGALVVMVSSGLGKLGYLSPDYAGPISQAATLQELRKAVETFHPSSAMPQHNQTAPPYSVSKAALNRAVQLLAQSGSLLHSRGIDIAAVCPGWCRTDMGTQAADRSAEEGAESILWPWEHRASVNGSFMRDGERLSW